MFAVDFTILDLQFVSGLSCAQGLLLARMWILLFAAIASHRICRVGLFTWISSWNFAKELLWSYDLNNRGAFKHFHFMCFRLTVLLLCIAILAWNYHSLDSLARNKQSNHQGL